MREPWEFRTEGDAKLKVSAGSRHATLQVEPALFPGIPAVTLSLVEIEELRGALGRAAAHLRTEWARTETQRLAHDQMDTSAT